MYEIVCQIFKKEGSLGEIKTNILKFAFFTNPTSPRLFKYSLVRCFCFRINAFWLITSFLFSSFSPHMLILPLGYQPISLRTYSLQETGHGQTLQGPVAVNVAKYEQFKWRLKSLVRACVVSCGFSEDADHNNNCGFSDLWVGTGSVGKLLMFL